MTDDSDSMLQRVRKFVVKYRNNGFDFKPNPDRYERQTLSELAVAVHEFEVIEEPPLKPDVAMLYGIPVTVHNLNEKMKELNRVISVANVQGLLPDNLTLKKLSECEQECTSLKSELDTAKSTINTLEHKVTELKTLIRTFKNVHPDLEVAIPESELEDGEPSSV